MAGSRLRGPGLLFASLCVAGACAAGRPSEVPPGGQAEAPAPDDGNAAVAVVTGPPPAATAPVAAGRDAAGPDAASPDAPSDSVPQPVGDAADPVRLPVGEGMKYYATTFAPGHTSSCWIDPDGKIRCKGADCCEANGGTRMRVPQRYAEARFRALALTHLTMCGVFAAPVGGKLFDCWGGLGENAASAPKPQVADVAQIGLGDSHACIRQSDGVVKCWGEAAAGTPPGLRARFLSVGPSMNCAIDERNAVVCWGPRAVAPPAGLEATYVSVFAEQDPVDARQAVQRRAYACAVATDGQVRCWGDVAYSVLRPPAGLRARSVSLGIKFGCAVRVDGTGVCWGTGAPIELGPVAQVAANFWLACALGQNNRVKCISGDAFREPPPDTLVLSP